VGGAGTASTTVSKGVGRPHGAGPHGNPHLPSSTSVAAVACPAEIALTPLTMRVILTEDGRTEDGRTEDGRTEDDEDAPTTPRQPGPAMGAVSPPATPTGLYCLAATSASRPSLAPSEASTRTAETLSKAPSAVTSHKGWREVAVALAAALRLTLDVVMITAELGFGSSATAAAVSRRGRALIVVRLLRVALTDGQGFLTFVCYFPRFVVAAVPLTASAIRRSSSAQDLSSMFCAPRAATAPSRPKTLGKVRRVQSDTSLSQLDASDTPYARQA